MLNYYFDSYKNQNLFLLSKAISVREQNIQLSLLQVELISVEEGYHNGMNNFMED